MFIDRLSYHVKHLQTLNDIDNLLDTYYVKTLNISVFGHYIDLIIVTDDYYSLRHMYSMPRGYYELLSPVLHRYGLRVNTLSV